MASVTASMWSLVRRSSVVASKVSASSRCSTVVVATIRMTSSASSGSSSSSSSSSEKKTDDKNRTYNFKTYTGSERRKLSARWENAFYGKVHYDPGMHEKYRSAVEEEEKMDEEIRQNEPSTTDATKRTSTDESSSSPFPPQDHDLTVEELRVLPQNKIKQYIVDRLTRGERRLLYATDYGGFTMMAQYHAGEHYLNQAEELLVEFGFMNDALRLKLQDIRDAAAKIKFDHDL